MSRPGFVYAAFFVALVVSTACGPTPRPADAYEDVGVLLADWSAKRAAVRSLRATGRIDQFGKDQRISGMVYVFARLPDALRVDLVSPLGHSLAVLAAQAGRFSMHDVREGRFLQGPAQPCNIARLVQIPLPVEDVVRLLIGSTPRIEGSPSLVWDPDKGAYAVTLDDGDAQQKLLIGPDRRVLPLLRSKLTRRGEVAFDVLLERWSPAGAHTLPREIRVKMPSKDVDLLLRYDLEGLEPDVNLPQDAFQLVPPPGMKIEEVTCE
jgi:hypothetical protein